ELFKGLEISHPKIKVFKPTNNVIEVFEKSNILIDVDAKAKEPIFISGKLMEYLSFDRYVFLISPIISPSYNLTGTMTASVIKATPDLENIVEGFEKAYLKKWNETDFNERLVLQKEFSLE